MNALLGASDFYSRPLKDFKQWCDIIRQVLEKTAMWIRETFPLKCIIMILTCPKPNPFLSQTYTFFAISLMAAPCF